MPILPVNLNSYTIFLNSFNMEILWTHPAKHRASLASFFIFAARCTSDNVVL